MWMRMRTTYGVVLRQVVRCPVQGCIREGHLLKTSIVVQPTRCSKVAGRVQVKSIQQSIHLIGAEFCVFLRHCRGRGRSGGGGGGCVVQIRASHLGGLGCIDNTIGKLGQWVLGLCITPNTRYHRLQRHDDGDQQLLKRRTTTMTTTITTTR
jgi:hypothetical protein